MRKLFLIGVMISILTSCQKKDEIPAETKSEYLPLSIGNYWVYEHYMVDSSGIETVLPHIDSIFINKDTLIRNNKYFILEGHNYPYQRIDIVRDSSKYLVNSKGEILFSETNFSDILYHTVELINTVDTVYTIDWKMFIVENQVNVPAGLFEALNYKGDINYYYGSQNSHLAVNTFLNNYYSPYVGRLLSTYRYYSKPYERIEKRLTRYYIVSN